MVVFKTVEEIVTDILLHMEGVDKLTFQSYKESDLILLHHGFGTHIRNTYKLWAGNLHIKKETGKDHPDDISFEIIKAAWKKLQKSPSFCACSTCQKIHKKIKGENYANN